MGLRPGPPRPASGCLGFEHPPLSRLAYLWHVPNPSQHLETERRGGIERGITLVHSYKQKTWLTEICIKQTQRHSTDKKVETSPMISYQKQCEPLSLPLSISTTVLLWYALLLSQSYVFEYLLWSLCSPCGALRFNPAPLGGETLLIVQTGWCPMLLPFCPLSVHLLPPIFDGLSVLYLTSLLSQGYKWLTVFQQNCGSQCWLSVVDM